MKETVQLLKQFMPFWALLGAFLVAYLVLPVIINVSHLKQLFDDPGEERKLHMSSIPNLGGIAIFASIFVVFAVSGYALQPWSPYLAAGLTILFFSGIKDDILIIAPKTKLSLQIVAVACLMLGGNMVITNLGGVFGLYDIPLAAGIGITFFTMVVVINAYNLIDGIDGLAAGIGIIASLFFGGWFWTTGMMAYATLAFTTAGALLAFMRFNFQPASIFMGDTGSQIVGYVLALLSVVFVKASVNPLVEGPFGGIGPVLVLAVLIVPLYDTLRVFLIRAFRGHSPFRADRMHVHHQLVDMGFSHRASSSILFLYNLAIITVTVLLAGMNINLLFGVVLLSSVILFPTKEIKRRMLESFGIELPSRRQIKVFEMKYGVPPETQEAVSRRNNGEQESRDRDSRLEEVAV